MNKPDQLKVTRLTGKKLQAINPKKQELTIEILRQFPGMEMLSDQEATKIIISINTLSSILYGISKKMTENGLFCIDNQQDTKNSTNLAA